MTPQTLYIRYKGWAVVRIPTDPDPSYEPNGASGYTFAFAGEPRLDRIFRLQPDPEYIRPGPDYPDGKPWPWGVEVFDAEIGYPDGSRVPVNTLVGCKVDMLGEPILENRNWLLTAPGWEPFVPYVLQIKSDDVLIQREGPLDRNTYWKLPTMTLMETSARGVYMETETIGTATGIWDGVALYTERKAWLQEAIAHESDPVKKQALESRIYEVNLGLARGPSDNRIGAHFAVERFEFGLPADSPTQLECHLEQGQLDASQPWKTSFFFGCFDADLLGTYVQGVLEIPFKQ